MPVDGTAVPNSIDGKVDNRGFTGHEMLDHLDLVHMNGRVYDPMVARFVSGDPLITDPLNGQRYNRYSYVLNNPTNLIDPTGFEEIDEELQKSPRPEPQTGTHIPGVATGASYSGNCSIASGAAEKKPTNETKSDGSTDAKNRAPVSGPSTNRSATEQGQQSGGDYSSGSNQVIIPGKRNPDNASPWGLGVEWLTGTGPKTHNFTDGDPFAEMLRKHRLIQSVIQRAKSGELKTKGRNPYSVGGLIGVPLYFHDYSNLLTGGSTGNLAVTFLGSYGLSYEMNDGVLTMTITNNSTISSATHPPALGYTQWWRQNVESKLNRQFESGPLLKTSQTIILHENIGGDRR